MKIQNIFSKLNQYEDQIADLEERIMGLEQKIETLVNIERNHLLRVKNKEEVPDEFIEHGRKYLDLTPEKAWKLYNEQDLNFIMIDVSETCEERHKISEAIHIPWSEFPERFFEIQSRTTPIFIISEDGTNSILACEFLATRGFFNCNNISGGYKHWKGFQLKDVKGISA